ncbi:uncharacterized protein LOC114364788 [Ostrinia furnacalis]|uniref:uncharacterized protein LOC114364788 n=1 Tax=Ostrinia furnacalis TaxID=93504 RepID=UPI0010396858|nr:uncharacterized protein LOC114364788 [Ostrinia furnacalis]
MNCAGCDSRLLDNEHLKCNTCTSFFCLACLSINKGSVSEIDPKQLAKLKCPSCSNVTRRNNDDSSPVRPGHMGGMLKPNTTGIQTRNNKKNISTPEQSPQVNYDATQHAILAEIRSLRCDMNKQFESQQANLDKSNAILSSLQKEVLDLGARFSSMRADLDGAIESIQFLSDHHDTQSKLNSDNVTTISRLLKDNMTLQSQVSSINAKLSQIEQQSRECNIEIQCVPEFKNENLLTTFQQLLKITSCELPNADIVSYHRVAKINSESERPRNIIVKLSSTRARDQVLAAVKVFNRQNKNNMLNTSLLGIASEKRPIYVTEHLSPSNKQLHAAARAFAKEKQYEFVWIRGGRIFIRKDSNHASVLVQNIEFLKTLK